MVRAKFYCSSKKEELQQIYNHETKQSCLKKVYTYQFSAVYSGSPENERFFASTPNGALALSCVTDDQFEPGKEYYLDISVAG
jgi:hypothetical protein